MAKRKIEGIHRIPARQVRELMKLPWVRDEELSDRWYDIRCLPDGRVLWYLGDNTPTMLYDSREIFAESKREAAESAAQAAAYDDKTLLPPIDDFLRDVEVHAKSLGKVLHIPEEALDFTLASLDVAYQGVLRLRRAKRMTPAVFTPLVAYVGEVMRRICDGHWTKSPTTKKRSVPTYDPAEMAAWREACAAANEAAAKARARGARSPAEFVAAGAVVRMHPPKPIRVDVIDEPITGHENEPMLWSRDGELLQPFAIVMVEIMEQGSRGSLRGAVHGTLLRYLAAE